MVTKGFGRKRKRGPGPLAPTCDDLANKTSQLVAFAVPWVQRWHAQVEPAQLARAFQGCNASAVRAHFAQLKSWIEWCKEKKIAWDNANRFQVQDFIMQPGARGSDNGSPRQRFYHLRWLWLHLGAPLPFEQLVAPRAQGDIQHALEDNQNPSLEIMSVVGLEHEYLVLEERNDDRADSVLVALGLAWGGQRRGHADKSCCLGLSSVALLLLCYSGKRDTRPYGLFRDLEPLELIWACECGNAGLVRVRQLERQSTPFA